MGLHAVHLHRSQGTLKFPELDKKSEDVITLTANIVSAYVEKNVVPQASLAEIIRSVNTALTSLEAEQVATPTYTATPAVPVKKSVQKDAITCLDCGKTFKSIRRHLNTSHDLTPETYRAK